MSKKLTHNEKQRNRKQKRHKRKKVRAMEGEDTIFRSNRSTRPK